MAIDPFDLNALERLGVLVQFQGVFMGHPEFIAFKTGGDVGVRLGIHIGVDSNADGRFLGKLQSHLIDHVQFGHAFYIEAQNTCLQGLANLSSRLAHPRKDHQPHVCADRLDALKFSDRDNVKPAPMPGKKLQNSQTAVGLHGVMHARMATYKTVLVALQGAQHGGLGVDEQRRAVCLGHLFEGHAFHHQFVGFVVHLGSAGQVFALCHERCIRVKKGLAL